MIDPKDLRIDSYPKQTGMIVGIDTGVYITHLPTGTVAYCNDERSQLQNRKRAMEILVSKLKELPK
jgi:peptide chain release factor 1